MAAVARAGAGWRRCIPSAVRLFAAVLLLLCAACPPPADPDPPARVRLANGGSAREDEAPPQAEQGPLPEGVERYELGALAVEGGRGPELLIDIDATVRSVTLVALAWPEASVVLERLAAPDGSLAVDPEPPAEVTRQVMRLSRGFPGPFLSTNRVVPKLEGGSFVVPASPELELTAGTWSARLAQGVVAVAADGAVDQEPLDRALRLTVLLDTRSSASRGQLPLAVHLTGAGGLQAANVADDTLWQAALATLTDSFADAGVDVTVAGYHDVEGGALLRSPELRPELCEGGELATLLGALAPTPGAVDVVLVDRLRCTVGGATVLDSFAGLAASVPGDALLEGGPHGGVALALGVVGSDPALAGHTLAHELGHLLGLFHTMEQVSGADPPIYDVVADTPDAPDFADNLMAAVPGGSRALTEGQAHVLRTNPWVAPAPALAPGEGGR